MNSNVLVAKKDIYKSTSIVYEENNTLNITDLTPGTQITRTFSITNNNSNPVNYSISWEGINSNWNTNTGYDIIRPEELIYSLSCSNGEKKENIVMPYNNDNNIIFENLELKTNKTNTCHLVITFLAKEEDQTYNSNKYFGGTYQIIVNE